MSSTPAMSLLDLENDPRLFLYTSLTAGSSHIVTATSRMETILKANKIPYQAIDVATDERAKRLWQRRGGGRKFPGLVKEGFVIGDLNEVEEWNEYGELKQNIGPLPAANTSIPKGGQTGVQTAPPSITKPQAGSASSSSIATGALGAVKKEVIPSQGFDKSKGIALPGAEEIKARTEAKKAEILAAPNPEKMTTAPDVKAESIEIAKETEEEKVAQEAAKETSTDTKTAAEEEASANTKTAVEETASEDEQEPAKDDVQHEETKEAEKMASSSAVEEEKKAGVDETVAAHEDTVKDVEQPSESKMESIENSEEAKTVDVEDATKVEDIQEVNSEGEKAEEKDDLPGATMTHRGSQVIIAPEEVIKKVENDNALPEHEDEDKDDAIPTEAIEGLKVADDDKDGENDHKKTQEQSAKDPTDAEESVKD